MCANWIIRRVAQWQHLLVVVGFQNGQPELISNVISLVNSVYKNVMQFEFLGSKNQNPWFMCRVFSLR